MEHGEKNSRLSNEDKHKYLKNKNHGNSKFQSIMIDVLKSDDMVKRIKSLVDTIQTESKNLPRCCNCYFDYTGDESSHIS